MRNERHEVGILAAHLHVGAEGFTLPLFGICMYDARLSWPVYLNAGKPADFSTRHQQAIGALALTVAKTQEHKLSDYFEPYRYATKSSFVGQVIRICPSSHVRVNSYV